MVPLSVSRSARSQQPIRIAACAAMLAVAFALTPAAALAQPIPEPIPGPSVNMVSGTEWPGGDPFLQRQNEGSIAVSTRNPLHLLAGGNDYRTVDIPGLAGAPMSGDAWNGLFWSRDGGNKWKSTLLAGYPQDTSPAGLASPIHGLQAGADSVVRAGTNGMMFFVGIAFNRESISEDASGAGKTGKLFITRFIDDNAKETGNPFRDLGTGIVDQGSEGRFMDKPWLAVDKPRPGAKMCSIPAVGEEIGPQTFPAGNIYVSYTVFVSNNPNFLRTKLMLARSDDCGVTWTTQKLSEGYAINQGAVIAIEPASGAVYVAWRRFRSDKGDTDGFLIAKSVDGGKTFTKGIEAQTFTLYPLTDGTLVSRIFDQGTSFASFRTTGFPALAVDNAGVVYLAWSERGKGPYGAARIMVKRSADGLTWSQSAFAIDNTLSPGHQIMPSGLFHGGKVAFLYYNLLQDSTIGQQTSAGELRVNAGNLAADPQELFSVFNDFVADFAPQGEPPLKRRHTADIWMAEASPTSVTNEMSFTSTRVSRYVFGEDWNSQQEPSGIIQYQFNPTNFPLFACNGLLNNCKAFIGDYVDIAGSPQFVPTGNTWEYNLNEDLAKVFHAVWTDNRDVRPPGNGQWQNYAPPNSPFLATLSSSSLFDPGQPRPDCTPGYTSAGMRNQNLYTSRITQGLVAGSPQNSKQLGYATIDGETFLLQRAFVVFVQNLTTDTKTFRLHIANQPAGGTASFLQFELRTELFVNVPAKSTATRSVFVTSTSADVSIRVDVEQYTASDGSGSPVTGGLQSTVLLNPDITNPDITNPDITNPDITNPDITNAEVYNPDITNPDITNPDITNPDITNPDITNPDITNPDITNPDITNVSVYNPDITNPDITNPDITNPDITNPDITNPDITNPDITNPDITNGAMTEATWTVTDQGNTTAGYKVKLLVNGAVPPDFKTQLIIHRGYSTPVAVGCDLAVQRQTVLVANIPNPVFTNVLAPDITNPDITNPDVTNATLFVGPGDDWVQITLRIADEDPFSGPTPTEFVTTAIIPAVVAQAVNTTDVLADSTTPPVALPTFVVTTVADSGPGSLRQAILDANSNGLALDTVRFAIPGTGPHTISPLSPLPNLATAIALDGTTQRGYAGSPLIVLDGATSGGVGLNITGGPSVVRGLAIDGFGQGIVVSSPGNTIADNVVTGNVAEGIAIQGAAAFGNIIVGNYIGLAADGTTAAGNGLHGISILNSGGNLIGGATAPDRNVVSANGGEGIRIAGALGTGNIVRGNYIGTTALGDVARGNLRSGVYLRYAPGNSISQNVISANAGFAGVAICGEVAGCGGLEVGDTADSDASGNVISGNLIGINAAGTGVLGNAGFGVSIDGAPSTVVGGQTSAEGNTIGGNSIGVRIWHSNPDDNLVRGNFIGTDITGTTNFGNIGDGVKIEAGLRNVVSGVDSDRTAPNLIKFNGSAGISVIGGTDAKLRINRIDSNGGPGIDLSESGNGLLPAPVLTAATVVGSTVHVTGTLTSTPSTTFTVDLYVSQSCDGSGYGEGAQWFGATTVTTDANGTGSFAASVGGGIVPLGGTVTALATVGDFVGGYSGSGSTSGFSACQTAAPAPDLVVTSLTHTPLDPTTVTPMTFTAVVTNTGTGPSAPSILMFTIGGETPGSLGTAISVPALAPGGNFTIQRTATLDVAQGYINTATADYGAVVVEGDELNNTTTDSFTVALSIVIGEVF